MIPAKFTFARGKAGSWVKPWITLLVGGVVLSAQLWHASQAFGDDALDGYKANLRQQRETYEAAMNSLDPLDEKTHVCSDIFKFKLSNDHMALIPLVAPTPRYVRRRVDLEGVTSPASINYVASVGRRPGGRFARFDFSSERFDDDAGTYNRLRILLDFRNLRISQTWRSMQVSRDVSLEDSPDGLRFNVTGTGIDTINLVEPTFSAMRRLHPRETERWLRPLLHDLGQDLLAPERAVAWQVLSDDWPEDAKAHDVLHDLLPDLGAANYHVREAAAKRLSDLGLAGATAVLRLDEHSTRLDLSAEQNRELDAILSQWRTLQPEEAGALHDNRKFLLDCLSSEDGTVRAVSLQRLQKLEASARGFVPQDLENDLDRRAETIATLRDRVLAAATQPTVPKK